MTLKELVAILELQKGSLLSNGGWALLLVVLPGYRQRRDQGQKELLSALAQALGMFDFQDGSELTCCQVLFYEKRLENGVAWNSDRWLACHQELSMVVIMQCSSPGSICNVFSS